MFTRRHYNKIVQVLAEVVDKSFEASADVSNDVYAYYLSERNGISQVLAALEDMFEEDNPNFNRDRFHAKVWE